MVDTFKTDLIDFLQGQQVILEQVHCLAKTTHLFSQIYYVIFVLNQFVHLQKPHKCFLLNIDLLMLSIIALPDNFFRSKYLNDE